MADGEVVALQRAGAALDAGDTPGARAALLEAWKIGRAPAVADLLSLLDAGLNLVEAMQTDDPVRRDVRVPVTMVRRRSCGCEAP